MNHVVRRSIVGEAIVATIVLAGLYGIARGVTVQPLQLPGYLLIVGFDVLEAIIRPVGTAYPAAFAIYLVGLGVFGTAAARAVRRGAARDERPGWRLGVAGALGAAGTLSIVYAATLFVGTTQFEPVLIAAVSGVVLLGMAGWLADLFEISIRRQ